MEAFHHTFNSLCHKQHGKQSSNTAERLRRSFAHARLSAAQPSFASDFVLASCSFPPSQLYSQASFRPKTNPDILSTHDIIVPTVSSLYRSSLRFRP
jgi:hypothetical protein